MRPLVAASLVVFFEVLSLGAMFPVLHSYCRELGAGPELLALWTGSMFALVAIPRIFMNTIWGRASDHWGRRRILALATFGTMSGSIIWALAPTLGDITPSADLWLGASPALLWLAASRIFAGFFQSQAALTQAIVADVATPEKRAAAMGHLGAAFGMGMLCGIAIGGSIGHYFEGAYVGWFSALAQAASLAIIVFKLKETHPAHAADSDHTPDQFQRSPLPTLVGHPEIRHLLAVILVMTIGHMVVVPTLGLLTENWYRFDEGAITGAFCVWMFLGILIQGGAIRPTVKRIGERNTILVGGAILATGFAIIGIGVTGQQPPLGVFWVAAILIAIGGSLADPALRGLLSRVTTESDHGATQGLHQSAMAIGRSISYLGAAALFWKFSPAMPYAVAAVVVVLSLLILLARKSKIS